ncbi:MAG TPA: class I SAM-dependent methyltransferase [Vicinamibacterales bacterium]|nr:class I SAM-dependent methyltransferase [Vicinamibacterales bacterium]
MRATEMRAVLCGAIVLLAAIAAAQPERDAARDKNEKVADVLAALEVSSASRIADVGAGDGFYSVRIARAMPASGRVMAVDVTEDVLARLRQRLEREQVTNVDITLGAFASPKLSDETYDAALIYNAYHEMTEYAPMLKGIFAALKPGGRLVMIEPIHDQKRKEDRAAQTKEHEISDDLTAEELQAAGFRIARKDSAFRPFTDPRGTGAWWLVVAVKP